MPVPNKPPPAIVDKVTHHSIELEWSEALKTANASLIQGDSRIRVCVQEQDDKTRDWGNVYTGYAQRHVIEGLEPRTLYSYRIRFMSNDGNSAFSATTSISTAKAPLTGEHLHSAVNMNDINRIETIMESGEVNIEVTDKYGFTPLMVASQKGFVDCVEKLLDLNADVDAKNDAGKTALMLACFSGKLQCVEMLRGKDASYTLEDKGGSTALHWAVDGGNRELIEWMLDDGADVNIKTGDSQWTPLLRNSAVKGDCKVAKLLLENGANIDEKDADGKTPLMMAVINGHNSLVGELLKNKADINIQNEYGKSAAMMARAMGNRSGSTIKQMAYAMEKQFGKTIYEMAQTMEKRMVIRTLEEYLTENNLLDADGIEMRKTKSTMKT